MDSIYTFSSQTYGVSLHRPPGPVSYTGCDNTRTLCPVSGYTARQSRGLASVKQFIKMSTQNK